MSDSKTTVEKEQEKDLDWARLVVESCYFTHTNSERPKMLTFWKRPEGNGGN